MNTETSYTQEHGNANDIHNYDLNSEIFKTKEVEETPFTVITIGETSFGTIGKYKLTNDFMTVEEAEEDVKKITWNRLVNVIMILQNNK